jgi:predicted DNA-binding transcriptional regulator YafY
LLGCYVKSGRRLLRHEKAKIVVELARRLAASAEGLTLDDIARELGVARRTAERLRDAVVELFPQTEEISDGAMKRFRIAGGLDRFFQSPTTDELLALNEAAAMFGKAGLRSGAKSLSSLEMKIRASMRDGALRKVAPDLEALLRAELIAVQAGPRPVEDEAVLKRLRDALLAMKALRFRYRGGTKPGARRKVTPYGLIFGRMNYLVAVEVGDVKPKSWRLDRIENLELIDESTTPPEDFSLLEFANASFGFFQAEQEEVVLHVLPHGVDDDFRNWRFHPSQTVEMRPDGSALVRFRASGMLELAWHLFSCRPGIAPRADDRRAQEGVEHAHDQRSTANFLAM